MLKHLKEADASRRVGMSEKEEKLKKSLIRMLINKDGKWGPYKHAAYAERLQDFDVYIVPIKDDPELTACVSFEDQAIYIGEGFLTDEQYFYQLNVVIRHEMAHNLLRHQIRMSAKMGDKVFSKLVNGPFGEVLNWLADFEVSNRKYTPEDKETMRRLWLNGKFIKCLVTEDHKKDWFDAEKNISLTIEEMYDRYMNELALLNKELIKARTSSWANDSANTMINNNAIHQTAVKALTYMDRDEPSFIWDPIDEFFKRSKLFKKTLNKEYQDYLKDIYNAYVDKPKEEVQKDFETLTDSSVIKAVNLNGIEALSTQEKLIANNVFKYLLGNKAPTPGEITIKVTKETHSKEYKGAYNEIIKKLGSRSKCDDDTLGEILKNVLEDIGYVD